MITATQLRDAFNRAGQWTARTCRHNLAVELRHVDTGELATEVWLPDTETWVWIAGHDGVRTLPKETGVDDLVKAVTESLPAGAK